MKTFITLSGSMQQALFVKTYLMAALWGLAKNSSNIGFWKTRVPSLGMIGYR